MKTHTPLALVILDGFGSAQPSPSNAISQAHTPVLNQLMKNYPHTQLDASGNAVGLPDGFVGNSQVGHMTIGAGQIVKQALTLINDAIADGSIFENEKLTKPLKQLAQTGKSLHIIGILSDAGVHGMLDHLVAYAQAAHHAGVKDIIIHPILDGRDVAPYSAETYLDALEKEIKNIPHARIGTMIGRFYAMDRDHNWDRTCNAYDFLTRKQNNPHTSWHKALKQWNQSEEFLPSITINESTIKEGDGVILANIRAERMWQLYSLLTGQAPIHCSRPPLDLSFCLTAVSYRTGDANGLFEIVPPQKTLKNEISKAGYSIFSIAETEKYAHVTSFFDSGNDKPYAGEQQIIVPSIKVQTYKDHPCMSAPKITETVIQSLETKPADFYLINYANGDMVGHSGSLKAAIKAVECLDKQIGELYRELVEKRKGTLIITADHGNVEQMIDVHGNPDTAHTGNKVPFILVNKNASEISLMNMHGLSDIAPFILQLLELPIPETMEKAR